MSSSEIYPRIQYGHYAIFNIFAIILNPDIGDLGSSHFNTLKYDNSGPEFAKEYTYQGSKK
ncbi:hypothetical protein ACTXT7_012749 [Hymenolepis weldensis]